MKRLLFSLAILSALIAGTLGAYSVIEVPEAVARTTVIGLTGQPPPAASSPAYYYSTTTDDDYSSYMDFAVGGKITVGQTGTITKIAVNTGDVDGDGNCKVALYNGTGTTRLSTGGTVSGVDEGWTEVTGLSIGVTLNDIVGVWAFCDQVFGVRKDTDGAAACSDSSVSYADFPASTVNNTCGRAETFKFRIYVE